MPKTNEELQKEIDELQNQIARLLTNPVVLGVLKMPVYTADPIKGSIGDLVVVGTKLKVCTAANTFTTVGTQT